MRRRCLYRGCRTLIHAGTYCPTHKPYGPGWAPLRAEILRRDDYRCRCQGCSQCMGAEAVGRGPCERRATTADHVDGDATHDDPSNLRAMCRPCNTRKGGLA